MSSTAAKFLARPAHRLDLTIPLILRHPVRIPKARLVVGNVGAPRRVELQIFEGRNAYTVRHRVRACSARAYARA